MTPGEDDLRSSPDTLDGELLVEQSAARGAKGIFLRFVLVVLAMNALAGTGMLIYDIGDSVAQTRGSLKMIGKLATDVCEQLRRESPEVSDAELMRRSARLTGLPMALLSKQGKVVVSTEPAIPTLLPRVFPTGPALGTRVKIDDELGHLSGAWMVHAFRDGSLLLTIVPRTPEEEGVVRYATIGAGALVLGLTFSVVAMLLAANWMLRRPLSEVLSRLMDALARDIQRRHRAEKRATAARLEAEEHLRFRDNLLNAAGQVGIVAADDQGKIRILNRTAEQVLGYSAEQVVDIMTLDELRQLTHRQPDDDKQVPHRSLIDLDEGEEALVARDGAERILQTNRTTIRGAEGEIEGELVVFVDVTDRKRLTLDLQLKELSLLQSAKLASLGEMATGVAHELSQPLNNIGLLATRMEKRLDRRPLDEAFFREKLDRVQTQVSRAGKIIQQLGTFARQRPMTLTSVSLARPVASVVELLREPLAKRGIQLEVDLPTDLPLVEADEAQLEQVLVNLLNNARDALAAPSIPSGGAQIRISAAVEPRPNGPDEVCLQVSDNGPGMAPEVASRIFEPFFTTKEVGKGTGLGLSISYGLVRDFGGKLSVETAPTEGATFTVFLQVAGAEGE